MELSVSLATRKITVKCRKHDRENDSSLRWKKYQRDCNNPYHKGTLIFKDC